MVNSSKVIGAAKFSATVVAFVMFIVAMIFGAVWLVQFGALAFFSAMAVILFIVIFVGELYIRGVLEK